METAVRLDTVGQRAPVDFDAVGVQVSQRSHEFIAVFNFEGDLLDEPLPLSLGLGDIDPGGGHANDEVMVRVVETQKGDFRAIGTLAAAGHLATQYLRVEFERPFKVRYEDAHVSNSFQLDTHARFPPCEIEFHHGG